MVAGRPTRKPKKAKTIIFDFDGTLADTLPLVMDVNCQIAQVPSVSEEEMTALRRLPVLRIAQHLGIASVRTRLKMLFRTRPMMTPRMREVETFPGVIETIKKLHAGGIELIILSSNYSRNVHIFLENHGIEKYFSEVRNCNVFYKAYALRRLVHARKLDKRHCYYVGNEQLDIRAAKKSGLVAVAVGWSGSDERALLAEEPDVLIHHPRELETFISEDAV